MILNDILEEAPPINSPRATCCSRQTVMLPTETTEVSKEGLLTLSVAKTR